MNELIIKEISSINEIDKIHWNRLVATSCKSIFHTWEWMAAYEKAYPYEALKGVHHLAIYADHNNLKAILPLFHLKKDALWVSLAADFGLKADELFNLDFMACHSWYSFYSYLIGVNDDEMATALLQKTQPKIEEICLKNGIKYCCFSAVEQNNPLWNALSGLGYRQYKLKFNNRIEIGSDNFGELSKKYFSKSIRQNIRTYRRRLQAMGIVEKWVSAPTVQQIDRTYELLLLTSEWHKNHLPLHPMLIIKSIFSEVSDYTKLLLFYDKDEICAAIICFMYDNKFYACFPGKLYDEKYQRLDLRLNLYRAYSEYAVEHGYRAIELGRGSYQYKRKFGSKPVATYTFIKAFGNDAENIYKQFEALQEAAAPSFSGV